MDIGMMGFGLLMMFVALLVVVAIIAIIVWAVIHFTGSGGSHPPHEGSPRSESRPREARAECRQHRRQAEDIHDDPSHSRPPVSSETFRMRERFNLRHCSTSV